MHKQILQKHIQSYKKVTAKNPEEFQVGIGN